MTNDKIKLPNYIVTRGGTVYEADTFCTNENRDYAWAIYKRKGNIKELDNIDLGRDVEV